MGSNYKNKQCPAPDGDKGKGSIVNILKCQTPDGCEGSASRSCVPAELIKNGGFEEIGIFGEYPYWDETADNIEFARFTPAYEGHQCAQFRSIETQQPETKTASISQSVTVTPGCFLILSFADNFVRDGEDFESLRIRVRVFYDSTNLIDIELNYFSVLVGQGFVFHQRMSDHPVPFNVSSVTVEFFVRMRDRSDTIWRLDGVSLRTV